MGPYFRAVYTRSGLMLGASRKSLRDEALGGDIIGLLSVCPEARKSFPVGYDLFSALGLYIVLANAGTTFGPPGGYSLGFLFYPSRWRVLKEGSPVFWSNSTPTSWQESLFVQGISMGP